MSAKTCPGCGETKPLDDFYVHKRDGRASRCKTCAAAYNARYNATHRESNASRKSAYRATAEGRCLEWANGYRERARMYGLAPTVETFTLQALIGAYGDCCAHCGGPFEQLDHYPVPVALGGEHTLENVRPSCAPCNLSQGKAAHLAAHTS